MTRGQAMLLWVLGSAGLAVIGAFGPWVKALGVSVSGTDGSNDGWLVVGAAAVGGGLFLATRTAKIAGFWALVGGAVGTATTIHDRNSVSDAISTSGGLARALVQIGWGLNLAMLASISFAISGLAWLLTFTPEAQVPAGAVPVEVADATPPAPSV
ncbi:MAG: hypothetical protein QOH16_3869 [Gaiellaceae bacterium]|nr:hypothetical protein [Gaiellaceae bacterium]